MSYDISIGNWSTNMTSNVSAMWDKAMPEHNLRDMDGYKASQVVDTLAEGVEHMARNRHEYLELDPENGWGDYGGALSTLLVMSIECERNPTETVVVKH